MNKMVMLQSYNNTEIHFDEEWLLNEIKPQTLDEFLNEYTWDDTIELYNKYQDEKGTK